MTRSRALAGGVLAAILGAAVAIAAPDRTTTLGFDKTTHSWEGGPVTGVPEVGSVEDDDTLLKLEAGGALTVKIAPNAGTTPGLADLDLYLYRANAAGDPQGNALKESETAGNDETVSLAEAAPGNYLARVSAYSGIEEGYDGKATLVPSGPGPGPTGSATATATASATASPGGSATPTVSPTTSPTATPTFPYGSTDTLPEARITKHKKRIKARKLKRFRGRAADDKGVARVEIAVVRNGKKCRQMVNRKARFRKLRKCTAPTKFLRAKGTTRWSFKLKRKLRRGRYTLYARAIDSAGQVQGGFGPASRKRFRVR